ncbi:MAG: DNA-processing protein DprA [Candidatus Paceibacterota bacterium]|jgi:DNA processing protein
MKDTSIRTIGPDEFPLLLREIVDPPKQLHIQGTIPPDDYKFLAVVGSRKYTSYGKQACEKLISGLRGQKICIVSGLALGIDAIAHKVALDAGLPTIAIPGSGIGRDVLYPATNRGLADSIISAGGALISEFENDFHATNWSFPQRNRIMAGFSHAILVVEAEQKSGTLITARLAVEYNRDVLVVPGSIFSSTSTGPHLFLRIGATPITKSEDILEVLGLDAPKQLDMTVLYTDCTDNEMLCIKILQEGPLSRNDLIAKTGLRISEASATLSLLEIKDLIKETMGEIRINI